MKKKLYFVVEKQLESLDGFEETNGWKSIQVYDIVNNVPEKFCDLDIPNTDNSKDAIQEYLDDNGYGDDEFELIKL